MLESKFWKKIIEEYNFRRYIGPINYSNCGGVDNWAAPVIIRESWSFSYDGHNYDIVTACNLYCVDDEVDLIYKDKEYEIASLPKNLVEIIEAGGLVKAMRKRNGLD